MIKSDQSIQLTRMYYVPTVYYWVDNMHEGVKLELNEKYNETKKIFYSTIDRFKKSTEKNSEYIEYKSILIRLILLDYAHFTPNGKGVDLLENIISKWKNNTMIKPKTKEMIYIRSITNILKYEKIINNIEEIMMLINLQILENYYK